MGVYVQFRKMHQIWLRGLPGAGKSTFGKLLVGQLPTAKYVSSGDLLRNHFRSGLSEGKGDMDTGGLANSELIMKLMADEEKKATTGGSTIMVVDGFPRRVEEVYGWVELTGEPRLIVYVECSENLMLKKLTNRRVCNNCNATYNQFSSQDIPALLPRQHGLCDVCMGPLSVRPDDKEDAVRRRLRLAHEEEKEIREYFSRVGLKIQRISSEGGRVSMNKTISEIVRKFI